jgi:diguanylate cyclase (GGDEF)-like protein
MNTAEALNIVLGSSVLIVLIFADYARKYSTDVYQRRLYLQMLVYTFLAMASDFVYYLVLGAPGKAVNSTLWVSLTLYYVFQVMAYYSIAVFINYLGYKDRGRTEKLGIIVLGINIAHILMLLFNLKFKFIFYVTDDNLFYHGDGYFVRMLISYAPVLLGLWDIFRVSRMQKKHLFRLLFLFLIITTIGSALDILFNTFSLVWPCFTAAQLYAYFFIIRNDARLDSLTGLGNRFSFNEFIDKLSRPGQVEIALPFNPQRRNPDLVVKRRKPGDSYSLVMIDMDHFKEINDTLGHLEGDNALRDMSAIIKACTRTSDFAARYGGDEFILASKAEYDTATLMERIQESIDELNNKNIRPYKLQISYGYDVFTTGSDISISDFLKHIDGLMYKQKKERRRASDAAKIADDAAKNTSETAEAR